MLGPSITHDLRSMFGDVRDQGVRPTCLAFAVSDCHAAVRNGWNPLSAEFVFYHAQRRAGLPPSQGALLLHILEAVRDDGQPPEASWPYLADLPADVSHWGPPVVQTRYFRNFERGPGSFDEILANLLGGSPTVIVLYIGEAFFNPDGQGVVAGYLGEKDVTRHAVIAVGAGNAGGQRALLVRNSWGRFWGLNGHVWVTENYISQRLRRIAVLKEEIGVSAHQNAA
ncbi:MAG: peptidase C1 [Mesorhizobium sp.]|uniref:C1 family peptidase n=1 Tax=Mesorhizobium sp. TaxID=1871066 RepID=UPI000FE585CF|nr:MAG: peptidase C1 [Mesorhizobium sp.]RWB79886.1 MAG: peptidase C1 [Mesorhizobium sp.]RWF75744.1 MAG: peptidase C1 [Mesorhizobium sp.]